MVNYSSLNSLSRTIVNSLSPQSKNSFADVSNNRMPDVSTMSTGQLVCFIILLILYILLVLFVGKLLFNNVLCVLFPGVKQASSMWQILGLMILFNLILP